MPIITVKMAKGRMVEQKRVLVGALTKTAMETLGAQKEWVTVLIEGFDRCNWAAGGELFSDKFGTGYGRQGVDQ